MDPFSFLYWRFHSFFRDPERHSPPGPVVVAPADGRVLYVSEVAPHTMPVVIKHGTEIPITDAPFVGPSEYPGVLIGIYMFPWSVHVNRAPVGGRITHAHAIPARHENRSMARALMHLMWRMPITDEVCASVAENARNTIVIEGDLPVAMVQIADRYVHQVDCFVHPGDTVERGQRVGMIRMGSQCDVFFRRIPGLEVLCQPGDRTRAGETVLARY